MASFAKVFVVSALVAIVAFKVEAASTVMPAMCSASEEAGLPCLCCKKSCWFGIAEMTTAYFGHMPGERSDAEAKFTLAMMHSCFKLECGDLCPASR